LLSIADDCWTKIEERPWSILWQPTLELLDCVLNCHKGLI
jgi:hypothetical protein